MSANAIASGSALLGADLDGLHTGLGKASQELVHWGRSTGDTLNTSLITSFGKGSGGGGIGGALSGLFTKIPPAAAVAAGAIAGVGLAAHTALDTIGELAATNKAASVLGVSASSYAGMQKVLERVGVEGDDVGAMFAKMGKNILTSASASEQFARMGIDAKALAGADLATQFKMIAEGFTTVPRGAEQARAALEIFGKSGATLLPILQKGKSGIEELIQGESFEILSDKQYAAAGKASAAWKAGLKDISGAWDGLVNHASVALAPIVGFVGSTASKFMARLEPVFDWWGRAWGQVGDLAGPVFEKLGEWADDFGGWLNGLVEELDVFGGGWPIIEGSIVSTFRAAGTAGAFAWDTIKSGAGAVAVGVGTLIDGFDGLVRGFKSIVDLGRELPSALKPEWFDKFADGVGRFESKVDQAGKSTKAWGLEAMQSWGKSAGTFNAWLDKALAPKVKAPEVVKAPEPVVEESKLAIAPARFASAIERGSKEAYSIEMRQRYGDFSRAENVHKENGRKQDETNRLLREVDGKQAQLIKKLEEMESM